MLPSPTTNPTPPHQLPHSLDGLPLYGIGVSAGAAFLLKMPRYLQVRSLYGVGMSVVADVREREAVKRLFLQSACIAHGAQHCQRSRPPGAVSRYQRAAPLCPLASCSLTALWRSPWAWTLSQEHSTCCWTVSVGEQIGGHCSCSIDSEQRWQWAVSAAVGRWVLLALPSCCPACLPYCTPAAVPPSLPCAAYRCLPLEALLPNAAAALTLQTTTLLLCLCRCNGTRSRRSSLRRTRRLLRSWDRPRRLSRWVGGWGALLWVVLGLLHAL